MEMENLRGRLEKLSHRFDIHEITCCVCMAIFTDPCIICTNGHTLCFECQDRCRKRQSLLHPECPACKTEMLRNPIVNRSATVLLGWFNSMVLDIVPFIRGDRVDVNLSYCAGVSPSQDDEDPPPFAVVKEDRWVQAVVQDLDLMAMEYLVVPDIPPDLMAHLHLRLSPLRIGVGDALQSVVQKLHTHTPVWRSTQWICEHRPPQLFYYKAYEWIPVYILWDKIDRARGTEHVLIGYEYEQDRHVAWIELLDENLRLTNPMDDMYFLHSYLRPEVSHPPASVLCLEASDSSSSGSGSETTDMNDNDVDDLDYDYNQNLNQNLNPNDMDAMHVYAQL